MTDHFTPAFSDEQLRAMGVLGFAHVGDGPREVGYDGARGGQIKATRLSDTFDWDQYQEANPGAIPLFVLDAKARPRVVTGPVTPLPGELLIALQPPREGATAL